MSVPVQEKIEISRIALAERFIAIRSFSREICEPLEIEDYVVQSMPDVSPTRWHLAHTAWFFETFLLAPNLPNYVSPNAKFEYLFNSYYNAVGKQFPRSRRGFLTRPTVRDVMKYRDQIDRQVDDWLRDSSFGIGSGELDVLELGLQHEQQHQELMLTDIKHVLSCNPLFPVYQSRDTSHSATAADREWLERAGGVVEIGSSADCFTFDNERPRHELLLKPYRLGSRPVTAGEYLEFIDDRGYERPELWLSMGWNTVEANGWTAPLYWQKHEEAWMQFTLQGLRPVDLNEPVCHVSYFEADAYARWANSRLPTEAEWELLAAKQTVDGELTDGESAPGHFVEGRRFHPIPAALPEQTQMFGDIWEWTASPYVAYPGYEPAVGALGEYNGKFMCNQYVLRGGSCATPLSHIRPTYRNFFPPEARWQFSGIRLAKNID